MSELSSPPITLAVLGLGCIVYYMEWTEGGGGTRHKSQTLLPPTRTYIRFPPGRRPLLYEDRNLDEGELNERGYCLL
jgi:hypothetical protein